MYQKIVILIILGISLFVQQVNASEDHARWAIFINQVRGRECCGAGNTKNFKDQITHFDKNNLTAVFALRFDALSDSNFVAIAQEASRRHEIAALLEVTPSLASQSGVIYKGNSETWYKASQVFLMGYSQEDRKKLIDRYMATYKETFGHFPSTTVAWMIDAYSLDYVSNTYGISVHEMTREQWGTDSYTLYGGPPHYPYFPSSNWPLIPGSINPSKTLIVRQTVADPLHNYGDFTSSFTSQPNDYRLDKKKDFTYFTKLLEQTLNQKLNPYSIAILGLENSMDEAIQAEYFRQIDWIKRQTKDINLKVIQAKDSKRIIDQNQPISTVHGKDLVGETDNEVWWITTNHYRARLLRDKNELMITDLRLYDDSMTDPYLEAAVSQENGYWVVPFIIDSSRLAPQKEASKTINEVVEFFLNHQASSKEIDTRYVLNPQPDLINKSNYLAFPTIDQNSLAVSKDGDNLVIKYAHDKTTVEITFTPQNIIHSLKNTPSLIGTYSYLPVKTSNSSLSWIDGESIWGFNLKNDSAGTTMTPFVKSDLNWQKIRNKYHVFFSPESANAQPDAKQSSIYIHNTRAIAGKNPIRMIMQGMDSSNLPAALPNLTVTDLTGSESVVSVTKPTYKTGPVWVDVASAVPGVRQIQFDVNGSKLTRSVRFVTNCKQKMLSCVMRPSEFLDYSIAQLLIYWREK